VSTIVAGPKMTPPVKEAGAFSPAVALWLIGAALVSGAMFVILLAFGPQLRGNPGGANALSRSAVGYAALVQMLRADRVPVSLNSNPVLAGAAPSAVLLIMPEFGQAQTPLPASTRTYLTVVVPPKWVTASNLGHKGWVTKLAVYDPGLLTQGLLSPLTKASWFKPAAPKSPPGKPTRGKLFPGKPALGADSFITRRNGVTRPILYSQNGFFAPPDEIQLAAIDRFQTFSALPAGWEAVLADEQGRTVMALDRQRRLLVLSDPDMLNTQGLATAQGALAAGTLIEDLQFGDHPVVFDLTLSGVGGRSDKYDALKLMLTPPFLSATLCGVAAALLMGLHAAIRFGPQRREGRSFALGKRALADNSAALIHMARREASMGPGYVALTRDLALEGVNATRTDDTAAIHAQLDRIATARRVDTKFEDLERDAGRARDGPSLLAAAQALYHWRLEITRGR